MNYNKEALDILLNNKKRNKNEELVLLAGNGKYSDLWTRDAAFGVFGLLSYINSKGKNDKNVKKCIKCINKLILLLCKYQREDGLITLRIGCTKFYQILKYIYPNIEYNNSPVYYDDKCGSEATDVTPLFIIICALFKKHTNIKLDIKNNIDNAFNYLIKTSNNGLLAGKYFNSWYDSFTLDGPDCFSNVLFGYSIRCYKYLTGINTDNMYKNFIIKFMDEFYNGNFLKITKKVNNLEIVSNSLAVIFEITDLNVSNNIHKSIKDCNVYNTIYPKLKNDNLYYPFILLGIEGYHNDLIWPWVTCIYTVMKLKMYNVTKNVKYLNNLDNINKTIDDIITINNDFIEIIDDDLKSHNDIFIKSEGNFTYFCGSYLLKNYYKENLFNI